LAAGVVVADGERARAAHPLLAAAARKHSDSAECRACHLELAEVVAEGDRRARHLALGTLYPGEGLARVIAAGAATAAARGAARSECGGDPWLRAGVLARKALSTAAEGVERLAEAEAWAAQALRDAASAGPEDERLALRALGWSRCLRGRPIDDLCERFAAAS